MATTWCCVCATISTIWDGMLIPRKTKAARSRIFQKKLCMKKSKFTDSQIMDALKRVEAGLAVPEACRELGVSSATFYKWRAKFGDMDTSLMSRCWR